MHRIMHLTLKPTPAQISALQQTMEAVNAARNQISALTWQRGMFTARALFEVGAEAIGLNEGLSLTMARRAIASVAAAYRVQRRTQRRYYPQSSIPYDHHTLRIDAEEQSIILWTLLGWLRILCVTDAPFLEGWSHPALMQLHDAWTLLLVVPDRDVVLDRDAT
jgi:hypothetical protein